MKPLVPEDRVVPWHSAMPKGCPIVPLKYLLAINPIILPENTPLDYQIRYIDISSVSSHGEITDVTVLPFRDAPSRARRIVKVGDTIVSTVRTYLKAIAYVEGNDKDLICSTGFAVLCPGHRIYPRFLFYWARSNLFVDEICARSTGVSYPAINAHEIGSLPFPVLDMGLQVAIARFLDRKLSQLRRVFGALNVLVSASDSATGALVDYRDHLITAAVTGQIDVRSHCPEGACP
jgi:type I restriction enzyme, S subunit